MTTFKIPLAPSMEKNSVDTSNFEIVNKVTATDFEELSLSELHSFNCGGFALGTKKWESFSTWDSDVFWNTFNGKRRYRKKGKMIFKMFEELSGRYPNLLKRYLSFSDAYEHKDKTEEIVAFRLSSTDFHFKLYDEAEDKWVEKRGGSEYLLKEDFESIFEDWVTSFIVYDGPIIFFTVKKREF